MPSDEPAHRTPGQNAERLLATWEAYLEAEGEHFASRFARRAAGGRPDEA
ncbi:MAG TPA: hypothetical protein RMH85_21560 [Polyangiaceae bacterium LLY-WYZ-15_(1-7)]|nr:hypothetical protein [Polyangiaceae bacterium LLY-WYZ-15_(1-7)]